MVKKIFWGGLRGPPKRGVWQLFGKKGVLGGPCSPPKNIFFTIFQRFVIFLVLSAFQQAFTFSYTHVFSRFMMFLVNLEFLVENLGISYSKICLKIANFKMRFQVAFCRFFFYILFLQLVSHRKITLHIKHYHFGILGTPTTHPIKQTKGGRGL